jgi:hypothetical protein
MESKMAGHALWSHDGTYPPRQGNEVDQIVDLQLSEKELADFGFNVLARLVALRGHPIE